MKAETREVAFMRQALALARRGYGRTSPNPMVGALLVRQNRIIGRGWHHRAGAPHAEVEAIRNATAGGHRLVGATLYVTLEPCSTHGRTPPCTEAIFAAGITRVVVGAVDPNPAHAGRGLKLLKARGVRVTEGVLAEECALLNEAFNHWIVTRRPWVTVKSAMTLDGKIATARGESKWLTGARARSHGHRLRQGGDAVLVGINTILADDPSLTARRPDGTPVRGLAPKWRIILDARARTPLTARVVTDEFKERTLVVVGRDAPERRTRALAKHVNVVLAPEREGGIDLRWLLKRLGGESISSVLVEGGGEVNASFLLGGHAHRVAFFYAPKILGGRDARKAVAGEGAPDLACSVRLEQVEWRWLGEDLLLTARVAPSQSRVAK